MSKKNSKMSSNAVSVGFRKIPEFKPKFELFLSGYAQVQNIVINGDYLITLDNDSTASIFKCEIDRPVYAPPKQEPTEINEKQLTGSPINLPSVGPINASSGVRHKDFKAGWNNRADDDTENEQMEMQTDKPDPKDAEPQRRATDRLDQKQLQTEEDEKMDDGLNPASF